MSSAWLPIAWLALLFLFGGSARADVPFLAFLRPAAVAVIGYAIWKMDSTDWASVRRPTAWLLALLGLTLLYLVPLPPILWNIIPRDPLVTEIGMAVGNGATWRPISVSSPDTLNAAMAVLPVLAMVLAMARLRGPAWPMIPALLVLAAGSILLGLLQMAGPDASAFYPYKFYNAGSPIGFFANRNHQAVFLSAMIPIAVAFALNPGGRLTPRNRVIIAAGSVVVSLAAIAALGSRAGVLTAFVGLAWSAFMVLRFGRMPALRGGWKPWAITGGIIATIAAMLFVGLGNSTSVQRVQDTDFSNEMRVEILPTVVELTRVYAPLGSGIGTFVQAYQAREEDRLLRPGYVNHAHNDWIEWLQTGSVPLLLLIVLAIAFLMRPLPRLVREKTPSESVLCAYAASSAFTIFAIASLFDYPLRTPAIAGVAAVAAVWIYRYSRSTQVGHD